VIDDYSDDWSKLAYVLVTGTAEIIYPVGDSSEHARAVELLREKYPQYRAMKIDQRPMIRITPVRIKRWAPAKGNNDDEEDSIRRAGGASERHLGGA